MERQKGLKGKRFPSTQEAKERRRKTDTNQGGERENNGKSGWNTRKQDWGEGKQQA